MLKKRFLSALWSVPILVTIIWLGPPWFSLLVAIWGLLAVYEFYRLVSAKIIPLTYLGLILTLLFILSPHFDYNRLLPLLITLTVVIPLVWLLMSSRKELAFIRWAWTIAGIMYIGWLLSHFVALSILENGRNWVFLAFSVTFASDTGAFFIGRAVGKRRLAPFISPGKTWEGAVGGVFSAAIASLFFASPTLFTLTNPFYIAGFSWWQALLLGLAVSIFGQLGDLVESLFKRNMGVKESGRAIPGHGGFLDRIDSVLFAGIAVYYFAWLSEAGWLN